MTGIPRFEDLEAELRAEHGDPGDTLITVSGFTGVGTSTVASFIAGHYGFDHVDAGQFFRSKAAEHDMTIEEFDSEAARIEEEQDIDFDLEWDRTVMRKAFTEDDLVLEGRLTGALLKGIAPIRVYVECDPETIAERMQGRESVAESIGDDIPEIRAYIEERNRKQLARYREKYGIDPRDHDFYNVVIDNSQELETVKHRLVRRIDELR